MAGLMTATEQTNLAADMERVFQTFERPTQIVVWKEPLKSVLSPDASNSLPIGFGDTQADEQYTFTPQSGTFDAIVRYVGFRKIGELNTIADTTALIPTSDVRIKVRQACFDYIESGKTDKISFDNRDFYFNGKPEFRVFAGATYYIYQLKPKS